jgi:cytochrome c-type biogenesis protein
MDLVGNFELYINQAPFYAYVAAFAGGLAASVTPCVYPMIPITVAYIGGRSAGSRPRAFALALAYVLGMGIMYSLLGAVAAMTGQLFGRVATSPYMFAVLGVVFVVMGLSMLDLFTIPLPTWLTGLQTHGKHTGLIGALVVGLFAGIAVGPCTAPALAVILAYVASHQNVPFGMSLLFTFAMGMGVLFLVVGTFAGVLMSLPKSGPWMVRVKQGFGLVIVGIGVFFFIQTVRQWG